MNVRLPCGPKQVPVDIPDNWINGRCYRSHRLEPAQDAGAAFAQAAASPVGGGSPSRVLMGAKSIAIGLDPTRHALVDELLPALLRLVMDASGLGPESVRIVVANNRLTPLERGHLDLLVPAEIRAKHSVVLHDPMRGEECVDYGTLPCGLPFAGNKAFAEADRRVILGAVYPHLIHGFMGGPSVVLPGLAHESTARELFRWESIDNAAVNYGTIAGNPVHQAGVEAMEAAGVDLAVCAPTTTEGAVAGVFVGEPKQAFVDAAAMVRERMLVTIKEPMDIIVTNGGGAPHDTALKEVINALSAALPVLKPGGTIVLAADLAAGVGHDGIAQILGVCGSPAAFEELYKPHPAAYPGQWLAQRYYQLLREHEVIVYSESMDEKQAWALGMTPTKDLQEAIHVAMQGHGQKCKIAALPDGPFSLAAVAS